MLFTYGNTLIMSKGIDFFEAFLFLDMATLTILYSILFFFLRSQTKRLLNANTTTDHQTVDDLNPTSNTQWEVRLGTDNDPEGSSPASPSGPVLVTKSVSIFTEGNPNSTMPRPNHAARQTYHRINKVSTTLLIYPVLYVIVTLPISLSRIAQFAGQQWGLTFAHFGAALFECTGWINVLLYTMTRKGLVSWNRLQFWKRQEKNVRRTAAWNTRNIQGGEMDTFDPIHGGRMYPKPSDSSSVATLKEDIPRHSGHKGAESDDDSQL